MTAKEMAKVYYPTLWNDERMIALVMANKLNKEEYKEITGKNYNPVK